MVKNKKKPNTLIKKNNLYSKIRGAGIDRISPDVFPFLETILSKKIDMLIGALKEQLMIEGRVTLQKKDVKEVLRKMEKEGKFWEI